MAFGKKLLNHHVSSHYCIALWTWGAFPPSVPCADRTVVTKGSRKGRHRRRRQREADEWRGRGTVKKREGAKGRFPKPPLSCLILTPNAVITLKGPGGRLPLRHPVNGPRVCCITSTSGVNTLPFWPSWGFFFFKKGRDYRPLSWCGFTPISPHCGLALQGGHHSRWCFGGDTKSEEESAVCLLAADATGSEAVTFTNRGFWKRENWKTGNSASQKIHFSFGIFLKRCTEIAPARSCLLIILWESLCLRC